MNESSRKQPQVYELQLEIDRNMLTKLIVLLVVASVAAELGEVAEITENPFDYCDPVLCAKGKKHIGCKHTGAFDLNCPANKTLIELTEENKEYILDIHNKFRNTIALGAVDGYEPASRMTTMLWDEQLAYLAILNVKQCQMRHDSCRGTGMYKYAGQNLCTRKKSNEFENVETSIDNCISMWFDEKEYASMNDINKCCNLESSNPIGHFTVIVNDRSNRVGCGMIRYKKKGKVQTLFACNYSFTNIIDKRVYITGKTASECLSGNNPDYEGLCNESEEINFSEH